MSNNYTQFCNAIATNLIAQEKRWLERYLDIMGRRLEVKNEYINLEVEGDTLYAQDNMGGGDLDTTVAAAQAFYARWRPDAVGEIEFAFTGDKHRPGEFGGGTVIFNRLRSEWSEPPGWAARMTRVLGEEVTNGD